MHDILDNTQFSDQNFELARDSADAGFSNRLPSRAHPRNVSIETLSDSNAAFWVKITYGQEVPTITMERETAEMFLTERDAQFLKRIQCDIDELNEPVRRSRGAEICRRFAETVGLALASLPQLRSAVFGDEEDGVELVAHSCASMRQVSFDFGLEGNSINIVSIDENMRRFERTCGLDKVLTLAEAIAWLKPR